MACATRILASWQGWRHKDVVPLLPRLESGYCESCGGSAPLNSERITWYNYHGQYNTGLPDYWLLKIEGERTNWGLGYLYGFKHERSWNAIINTYRFVQIAKLLA